MRMGWNHFATFLEVHSLIIRRKRQKQALLVENYRLIRDERELRHTKKIPKSGLSNVRSDCLVHTGTEIVEWIKGEPGTKDLNREMHLGNWEESKYGDY